MTERICYPCMSCGKYMTHGIGYHILYECRKLERKRASLDMVKCPCGLIVSFDSSHREWDQGCWADSHYADDTIEEHIMRMIREPPRPLRGATNAWRSAKWQDT